MNNGSQTQNLNAKDFRKEMWSLGGKPDFLLPLKLEQYFQSTQRAKDFSYTLAFSFTSLSLITIAFIHTKFPAYSSFEALVNIALTLHLNYFFPTQEVINKKLNDSVSKLDRSVPFKFEKKIQEEIIQEKRPKVQSALLIAFVLFLVPFTFTGDLVLQTIGVAINIMSIALYGLKNHIEKKIPLSEISLENMKFQIVIGESLITQEFTEKESHLPKDKKTLSIELKANSLEKKRNQFNPEKTQSLGLALASRLFFLEEHGEYLLKMIERLEKQFGSCTLDQFQVHLSEDYGSVQVIRDCALMDTLKDYVPLACNQGANAAFTKFFCQTLDLQEVFPRVRDHVPETTWNSIKSKCYRGGDSSFQSSSEVASKSPLRR